MRRRVPIGLALLALSHWAFVDVSSALAQAGSTGGTIGKQDKSISGDRPELDRPHAAPPAKRSIANPRGKSDASCGKIVGTWTWYLGVTATIFEGNGTAQSSSGPSWKWICVGTNSAVSSNGSSKEEYKISQDGNSLFVTSSWAEAYGSRLRAGTSFHFIRDAAQHGSI